MSGLRKKCCATLILWCATVLNASIAFSAVGAATDSSLSLRLSPSGPAETVFDWASMRCEDWDVPDIPARAWQDADGTVHLLASHFRNRLASGPALNDLRHACPVIFEGSGQDTPALHDDRAWIASTYSIDGETVVALIHNEFQGHSRPNLCPAARYMACWRNSLTMAISRDGGRSFRHETPPHHYVAGVPYRYAGDAKGPTGYFAPSNIIARDGFFYAFFWAEATEAQRRGVCLMRTADPTDRKSWHGWNGSTFSVAFRDPYADDIGDAARHVCAPVASDRLVNFVASVVKHRPSGLYVALMASTRHVDGKPISGIFSATSPDLIAWSTPALVLDLPMQFDFACSDEAAFFYPSLLDPNAHSRNFEDTGDRPNLYLTKIYLDKCKLGMRRDLVRIPVAIEVRH